MGEIGNRPKSAQAPLPFELHVEVVDDALPTTPLLSIALSVQSEQF